MEGAAPLDLVGVHSEAEKAYRHLLARGGRTQTTWRPRSG